MPRALPLALALTLAACGASSPNPEEPSEDQTDHAAGHPGAERRGHAHHGHAHHGPAHHDHEHHGQGHHHDFSDVERFAAIFDAPERTEWQMPEHVVELMAIEPGMTVVDLGAGTGYFLPHLRAAVGDEGCVVALDVEPNMVEHMSARIAEAGWSNVVARVVDPADPGLAAASIDRILVVDTWHHIGERGAYAARLAEALSGPRPGALTIVDFTREAPHGPPPAMRLAADAVLAELAPARFEARALEERLPHQWVVGAQAPTSEAARGASPCAAP